jgi:hypothetical protein
MKTEMISLQRRYLMIAGAVTAVIPAVTISAAEAAGSAQADAAGRYSAVDLPLVLSGRLTAADGRALAGAQVDTCVFGERLDGQQVHSDYTDADGRFMISAANEHRDAGGLVPMHVRVSHPGRRADYFTLVFTPSASMPDAVTARTVVEGRTVRSSFALTMG